MNLRSKVQVLNIVLGILVALVLGLGLTSFFSIAKLNKAKRQNLEHQVQLFERSLEDVRTCLEAEEYELAKIRLSEALELLKDGEAAAQEEAALQQRLDAIRKKYCRIWKAPEWSYQYRASNHPELEKGFQTICK